MSARITVVEQVYYQPEDGGDRSIPHSYNYNIANDAQVWLRTKTVTDWERLEVGWAKEPSLLLLRNEGGPCRAIKPTPEQREDDASRLLELAVLINEGPFILSTIPPGQSARIPFPVRPDMLWVRCRNGSTRYTVHMVP